MNMISSDDAQIIALIVLWKIFSAFPCGFDY